MNKYLILYGWGGSLPPHWQDWLARELTRSHHAVWFPKLPHRYSPKKHQWMNKTRYFLETFHPDTVICHSLACTLWLHLCEEGLISPVKQLILVAPPRLDCDIQDIASFFPCPIPQTLKAEEVHLVTSTNDHYLSPDEAKALQESLGIPMTVIEEGGHINEKSGYGEWPWVYQWATGQEWKEFQDGESDVD